MAIGWPQSPAATHPENGRMSRAGHARRGGPVPARRAAESRVPRAVRQMPDVAFTGLPTSYRVRIQRDI